MKGRKIFECAKENTEYYNGLFKKIKSLYSASTAMMYNIFINKQEYVIFIETILEIQLRVVLCFQLKAKILNLENEKKKEKRKDVCVVHIASDDGPVVPKLTREILVVLLNPSVDTVVPNLSADFPLVLDPVTVVPASPDDGTTVSEPTIDGPVVPDPPDLMFPVASTDDAVVDDLISPFPVGLDPLADGPVVPKPTKVIVVVPVHPSVDTDVPLPSSEDPLDPDLITVVSVFADKGPIVSELTADGLLAPDAPGLVVPIAPAETTVVDEPKSLDSVVHDSTVDGSIVPAPETETLVVPVRSTDDLIIPDVPDDGASVPETTTDVLVVVVSLPGVPVVCDPATDGPLVLDSVTLVSFSPDDSPLVLKATADVTVVLVIPDDGEIFSEATGEILVAVVSSADERVNPDTSPDFPLVPDRITVVVVSPDKGPAVSKSTLDILEAIVSPPADPVTMGKWSLDLDHAFRLLPNFLLMIQGSLVLQRQGSLLLRIEVRWFQIGRHQSLLLQKPGQGFLHRRQVLQLLMTLLVMIQGSLLLQIKTMGKWSLDLDHAFRLLPNFLLMIQGSLVLQRQGSLLLRIEVRWFQIGRHQSLLLQKPGQGFLHRRQVLQLLMTLLVMIQGSLLLQIKTMGKWSLDLDHAFRLLPNFLLMIQGSLVLQRQASLLLRIEVRWFQIGRHQSLLLQKPGQGFLHRRQVLQLLMTLLVMSQGSLLLQIKTMGKWSLDLDHAFRLLPNFLLMIQGSLVLQRQGSLLLRIEVRWFQIGRHQSLLLQKPGQGFLHRRQVLQLLMTLLVMIQGSLLLQIKTMGKWSLDLDHAFRLLPNFLLMIQGSLVLQRQGSLLLRIEVRWFQIGRHQSLLLQKPGQGFLHRRQVLQLLMTLLVMSQGSLLLQIKTMGKWSLDLDHAFRLLPNFLLMIQGSLVLQRQGSLLLRIEVRWFQIGRHQSLLLQKPGQGFLHRRQVLQLLMTLLVMIQGSLLLQIKTMGKWSLDLDHAFRLLPNFLLMIQGSLVLQRQGSLLLRIEVRWFQIGRHQSLLLQKPGQGFLHRRQVLQLLMTLLVMIQGSLLLQIKTMGKWSLDLDHAFRLLPNFLLMIQGSLVLQRQGSLLLRIEVRWFQIGRHQSLLLQKPGQGFLHRRQVLQLLMTLLVMSQGSLLLQIKTMGKWSLDLDHAFRLLPNFLLMIQGSLVLQRQGSLLLRIEVRWFQIGRHQSLLLQKPGQGFLHRRQVLQLLMTLLVMIQGSLLLQIKTMGKWSLDLDHAFRLLPNFLLMIQGSLVLQRQGSLLLRIEVRWFQIGRHQSLLLQKPGQGFLHRRQVLQLLMTLLVMIQGSLLLQIKTMGKWSLDLDHAFRLLPNFLLMIQGSLVLQRQGSLLLRIEVRWFQIGRHQSLLLQKPGQGFLHRRQVLQLLMTLLVMSQGSLLLQIKTMGKWSLDLDHAFRLLPNFLLMIQGSLVLQRQGSLLLRIEVRWFQIGRHQSLLLQKPGQGFLHRRQVLQLLMTLLVMIQGSLLLQIKTMGKWSLDLDHAFRLLPNFLLMIQGSLVLQRQGSLLLRIEVRWFQIGRHQSLLLQKPGQGFLHRRQVLQLLMTLLVMIQGSLLLQIKTMGKWSLDLDHAFRLLPNFLLMIQGSLVLQRQGSLLLRIEVRWFQIGRHQSLLLQKPGQGFLHRRQVLQLLMTLLVMSQGSLLLQIKTMGKWSLDLDHAFRLLPNFLLMIQGSLVLQRQGSLLLRIEVRWFQIGRHQSLLLQKPGQGFLHRRQVLQLLMTLLVMIQGSLLLQIKTMGKWSLDLDHAFRLLPNFLLMIQGSLVLQRQGSLLLRIEVRWFQIGRHQSLLLQKPGQGFLHRRQVLQLLMTLLVMIQGSLLLQIKTMGKWSLDLDHAFRLLPNFLLMIQGSLVLQRQGSLLLRIEVRWFQIGRHQSLLLQKPGQGFLHRRQVLQLLMTLLVMIQGSLLLQIKTMGKWSLDLDHAFRLLPNFLLMIQGSLVLQRQGSLLLRIEVRWFQIGRHQSLLLQKPGQGFLHRRQVLQLLMTLLVMIQGSLLLQIKTMGKWSLDLDHAFRLLPNFLLMIQGSLVLQRQGSLLLRIEVRWFQIGRHQSLLLQKPGQGFLHRRQVLQLLMTLLVMIQGSLLLQIKTMGKWSLDLDHAFRLLPNFLLMIQGSLVLQRQGSLLLRIEVRWFQIGRHQSLLLQKPGQGFLHRRQVLQLLMTLLVMIQGSLLLQIKTMGKWSLDLDHAFRLLPNFLLMIQGSLVLQRQGSLLLRIEVRWFQIGRHQSLLLQKPGQGFLHRRQVLQLLMTLLVMSQGSLLLQIKTMGKWSLDLDHAFRLLPNFLLMIQGSLVLQRQGSLLLRIEVRWFQIGRHQSLLLQKPGQGFLHRRQVLQLLMTLLVMIQGSLLLQIKTMGKWSLDLDHAFRLLPNFLLMIQGSLVLQRQGSLLLRIEVRWFQIGRHQSLLLQKPGQGFLHRRQVLQLLMTLLVMIQGSLLLQIKTMGKWSLDLDHAFRLLPNFLLMIQGSLVLQRQGSLLLRIEVRWFQIGRHQSLLLQKPGQRFLHRRQVLQLLMTLLVMIQGSLLLQIKTMGKWSLDLDHAFRLLPNFLLMIQGSLVLQRQGSLLLRIEVRWFQIGRHQSLLLQKPGQGFLHRRQVLQLLMTLLVMIQGSLLLQIKTMGKWSLDLDHAFRLLPNFLLMIQGSLVLQRQGSLLLRIEVRWFQIGRHQSLLLQKPGQGFLHRRQVLQLLMTLLVMIQGSLLLQIKTMGKWSLDLDHAFRLLPNFLLMIQGSLVLQRQGSLLLRIEVRWFQIGRHQSLLLQKPGQGFLHRRQVLQLLMTLLVMIQGSLLLQIKTMGKWSLDLDHAFRLLPNFLLMIQGSLVLQRQGSLLLRIEVRWFQIGRHQSLLLQKPGQGFLHRRQVLQLLMTLLVMIQGSLLLQIKTMGKWSLDLDHAFRLLPNFLLMIQGSLVLQRQGSLLLRIEVRWFQIGRHQSLLLQKPGQGFLHRRQVLQLLMTLLVMIQGSLLLQIKTMGKWSLDLDHAFRLLPNFLLMIQGSLVLQRQGSLLLRIEVRWFQIGRHQSLLLQKPGQGFLHRRQVLQLLMTLLVMIQGSLLLQIKTMGKWSLDLDHAFRLLPNFLLMIQGSLVLQRQGSLLLRIEVRWFQIGRHQSLLLQKPGQGFLHRRQVLQLLMTLLVMIQGSLLLQIKTMGKWSLDLDHAFRLLPNFLLMIQGSLVLQRQGSLLLRIEVRWFQIGRHQSLLLQKPGQGFLHRRQVLQLLMTLLVMIQGSLLLQIKTMGKWSLDLDHAFRLLPNFLLMIQGSLVLQRQGSLLLRIEVRWFQIGRHQSLLLQKPGQGFLHRRQVLQLLMTLLVMIQGSLLLQIKTMGKWSLDLDHAFRLLPNFLLMIQGSLVLQRQGSLLLRIEVRWFQIGRHQSLLLQKPGQGFLHRRQVLQLLMTLLVMIQGSLLLQIKTMGKWSLDLDHAFRLLPNFLLMIQGSLVLQRQGSLLLRIEVRWFQIGRHQSLLLQKPGQGFLHRRQVLQLLMTLLVMIQGSLLLQIKTMGKWSLDLDHAFRLLPNFLLMIQGSLVLQRQGSLLLRIEVRWFQIGRHQSLLLQKPGQGFLHRRQVLQLLMTLLVMIQGSLLLQIKTMGKWSLDLDHAFRLLPNFLLMIQGSLVLQRQGSLLLRIEVRWFQIGRHQSLLLQKPGQGFLHRRQVLQLLMTLLVMIQGSLLLQIKTMGKWSLDLDHAFRLLPNFLLMIQGSLVLQRQGSLLLRIEVRWFQIGRHQSLLLQKPGQGFLHRRQVLQLLMTLLVMIQGSLLLQIKTMGKWSLDLDHAFRLLPNFLLMIQGSLVLQRQGSLLLRIEVRWFQIGRHQSLLLQKPGQGFLHRRQVLQLLMTLLVMIQGSLLLQIKTMGKWSLDLDHAFRLLPNFLLMIQGSLVLQRQGSLLLRIEVRWFQIGRHQSLLLQKPGQGFLHRRQVLQLLMTLLVMIQGSLLLQIKTMGKWSLDLDHAFRLLPNFLLMIQGSLVLQRQGSLLLRIEVRWFQIGRHQSLLLQKPGQGFLHRRQVLQLLMTLLVMIQGSLLLQIKTMGKWSLDLDHAFRLLPNFLLMIQGSLVLQRQGSLLLRIEVRWFQIGRHQSLLLQKPGQGFLHRRQVLQLLMTLLVMIQGSLLLQIKTMGKWSLDLDHAFRLLPNFLLMIQGSLVLQRQGSLLLRIEVRWFQIGRHQSLLLQKPGQGFLHRRQVLQLLMTLLVMIQGSLLLQIKTMGKWSLDLDHAFRLLPNFLLMIQGSLVLQRQGSLLLRIEVRWFQIGRHQSLLLQKPGQGFLHRRQVLQLLMTLLVMIQGSLLLQIKTMGKWSLDLDHAFRLLPNFLLMIQGSLVLQRQGSLLLRIEVRWFQIGRHQSLLLQKPGQGFLHRRQVLQLLMTLLVMIQGSLLLQIKTMGKWSLDLDHAFRLLPNFLLMIQGSLVLQRQGSLLLRIEVRWFQIGRHQSLLLQKPGQGFLHRRQVLQLLMTLLVMIQGSLLLQIKTMGKWSLDLDHAFRLLPNFLLMIQGSLVLQRQGSLLLRIEVRWFQIGRHQSLLLQKPGQGFLHRRQVLQLLMTLLVMIQGSLLLQIKTMGKWSLDLDHAFRLLPNFLLMIQGSLVLQRQGSLLLRIEVRWFQIGRHQSLLLQKPGQGFLHRRQVLQLLMTLLVMIQGSLLLQIKTMGKWSLDLDHAFRLLPNFLLMIQGSLVLQRQGSLLLRIEVRWFQIGRHQSLLLQKPGQGFLHRRQVLQLLMTLLVMIQGSLLLQIKTMGKWSLDLDHAFRLLPNFLLMIQGSLVLQRQIGRHQSLLLQKPGQGFLHRRQVLQLLMTLLVMIQGSLLLQIKTMGKWSLDLDHAFRLLPNFLLMIQGSLVLQRQGSLLLRIEVRWFQIGRHQSLLLQKPGQGFLHRRQVLQLLMTLLVMIQGSLLLQIKTMGKWSLDLDHAFRLLPNFLLMIQGSLVLQRQLKAHWFPVLQQPSLQLQLIWQFAGNLHPLSPLLLTFLWLIQVSRVFQRRRNGCRIAQP
ncbi:hypothetical protein MJG53_004500 [Ovis ammon polii x Ovis aries]|uniref:Uncharacterized protein n=1 Tax=Ovis ammon polii x Ovis aries TaxID=2918886 RepID=A0ACB9VA59_9CETA|nr:hypothetical protein MJG53_004500 [Ovis ammon polii x Ovis aries]